MDDAHETPRTAGPGLHWYGGPTVKQRTAVQQLVRDLFDALVPDRPPARVGRLTTDVQLVRSPRGCILQSAGRAVSVSWFAASMNEAAYGELQIIVWDGVVSRPGSATRAAGGAVARAQTVLHPEERGPDAWTWRTSDGRACDPATLAAHCHALLGDEHSDDGLPLQLAG